MLNVYNLTANAAEWLLLQFECHAEKPYRNLPEPPATQR